GVFEGIRAYWNPAEEQLYVFRLREHFERMARSVRIVRITLPADPEALSTIALELLRKNGFKSDVYVRPLAFKAARSVKVALQGVRDGFGMYAFPLGAYLPTGGLVARTASWRRTPDDAIPARGKLTGAYINTALAVDEAHDFEADEAIFLTADGFSCGTGAQVAPCVKIDGRVIGDGAIGPVAKRIGDLYYAVAHADDKRHPEWRTAVYR